MKLFENLREDLPASIVVFFVAVPLCLGIALASGVPLVSGLVAGIIGGIVVGAMSGSPLGVSGPAAGLVVIVLGTVQVFGYEAFLVTVVLGGLIQIGLGLARAGMISNLFPSSVIKGMLTGIGIIIILKQIPHAVGFDEDFEGNLDFFQPDGGNTLTGLMEMWQNLIPSAVLITLVAMGIMLLWEKVLAPRHMFFKLFPGPLAAVIFGIVAQIFFSSAMPGFALSDSHLVNVPVTSSPAEFYGMLASPDWSYLFNKDILIASIVLAVVASLETLLCVEATDKLDPWKRKTPANRELLAQGGGNIMSGLLGGLPITQVIVRSSANIQAGAKSKLSGIMHGMLILVFVLAAPRLLNLIPLAVLAAILLLTGYKLAQPRIFRAMYATGKEQFVPFIATVIGVVLTDLLMGIAIGMVISIFTLLYRNFINSHMIERIKDGNKDVIRMKLCEELTFLNKTAIIQSLNELPPKSHLIIDASNCFSIDSDVVEIFKDFAKEGAKEKGIYITVEHPESPIMKTRLDFLTH